LSSINHSIFSGRREPSWAGLCDIVRFEEWNVDDRWYWTNSSLCLLVWWVGTQLRVLNDLLRTRLLAVVGFGSSPPSVSKLNQRHTGRLRKRKQFADWR
jgi:hypothetical protein